MLYYSNCKIFVLAGSLINCEGLVLKKSRNFQPREALNVLLFAIALYSFTESVCVDTSFNLNLCTCNDGSLMGAAKKSSKNYPSEKGMAMSESEWFSKRTSRKVFYSGRCVYARASNTLRVINSKYYAMIFGTTCRFKRVSRTRSSKVLRERNPSWKPRNHWIFSN